MNERPTFCTCKDRECPFNPQNHDKGCTPCIEKNLKEGEIPSCFFNAVGGYSGTGYRYEDFAAHVVKTRRNLRMTKFFVRFFLVLSAVLVILFGVMVGFYWYKYNNSLNSAPFSVFVLVRALECLVPAVFCLGAAFFMGRKPKRDKEGPYS